MFDRRTAKIMTRLHRCKGWYGSLLFAFVLRSLFAATGPYRTCNDYDGASYKRIVHVCPSTYGARSQWWCYYITGKGKSIWDTVAQTPGNIYNNDNGNIACDSYHKYKEDVQLIRAMGVSGVEIRIMFLKFYILALILRNSDMPTFANGVDPDQLASQGANWSWFTLFFSMWFCINNLDQEIWLTIGKESGIYSAWQDLTSILHLP